MSMQKEFEAILSKSMVHNKEQEASLFKEFVFNKFDEIMQVSKAPATHEQLESLHYMPAPKGKTKAKNAEKAE